MHIGGCTNQVRSQAHYHQILKQKQRRDEHRATAAQEVLAIQKAYTNIGWYISQLIVLRNITLQLGQYKVNGKSITVLT